MRKHSIGKDQHFVPQQMIRNFAGRDGKLAEMVKPELRMATRRRAPRGILFGEHFCRDAISDFDAQFLTPIEQRFSLVYPAILTGAQLDGRQGAAFVDWVAAMLVRTQLIIAVMPMVPEGLPNSIAEVLREAKKLFDNSARLEWFTWYQNLFARQRWRWKLKRFPRQCLVLTDHPVCITSMSQEGGQMVLVPMAGHTILFGGAREAVERMRDATPLDVDFFLSGYANRHVFAAHSDILETAKEALSDRSPFPRDLVEAARQPFFGAPGRLRQRMLSSRIPEGFDFAGALRAYAESFGRFRWEAES